jgi:multimeric flavodoxin WrbA
MRILAINGSPRKDWNTAKLLTSALDGAAANGAETELIHLYELSFKGCTSCFACKLKEGKSYGQCALKDELTPVLQKIANADALLLGSPIYFGNVTGEMRSFMERLLFPYGVYAEGYPTLFPKKIPTAFFYTMNVNEDRRQQFYDAFIKLNESILTRIFGSAESLCATDTYQFDDYAKYVCTLFDPAEKKQRQQEVFPEDCERAYALGAKMAVTAKA